MRFLSAEISCFRNIRELALDLSEDGAPLPLALLVGPNGAGKTAVLDALVRLSFPFGLSGAINGGSRPYVFDLSPSRQAAKLSARILPAPWEIDKADTSPQDVACEFRERGTYIDLIQKITPHQPRDVGRVPLLFMDAARHAPRQSISAITPGSSQALSEGATAASLDANRHQWTKQQLVNLKWAEYRERDKTGRSEVFTRLWGPVHEVLEGVRFREIDEGLNILFDTPSGAVEFDDLSSGEKSVILMMAEIQLRRVEYAAVLIDEIELHLHPRLQAKILDALRALAPTCQLIVTTQSPLVVASAKHARNVFVLGDL